MNRRTSYQECRDLGSFPTNFVIQVEQSVRRVRVCVSGQKLLNEMTQFTPATFKLPERPHNVSAVATALSFPVTLPSSYVLFSSPRPLLAV